MGRKGFSLALLLATLGSVLPSPAHALETDTRCRRMTTSVKSFTVETAWSSKTYARGSKVKVEVTVTRPGPEDPLDNGIPLDSPQHFPVEGASVSVTLLAGFPYPYGLGTTDADGKAIVKVKLPRSLKGPINSSTHGYLTHNKDGPNCTDVQEENFKYEAPAFVIR